MSKKRTVAPEDLFNMRLISEMVISPSGNRVAYTVKEGSLEQNRYLSNVYVVDAANGTSRRFTTGPEDHSPRWSPDGTRLSFISDRAGTGQLFLMHADGGEAQQVTHLDTSVSDPVWSPDGEKIAFTTRRLSTDYEEPEGELRIIKRAYYRSDADFLDDKWSQIWVVDVKTQRAWQLTEGDYEHSSPAWSPDSQHLAFSACRPPDPEDADFLPHTDIWVSDLDGHLTQVTQEQKGPAQAPAWSPDGTEIAFIGNDNHRPRGMNNQVLWAVPASGGRPTRISADDFDRSIGNDVLYDLTLFRGLYRPVWSTDGKVLYSYATFGGSVHVFSTHRKTGEIKLLTTGERLVYAYDFDQNRQVMSFASSRWCEPGDVYIAPLENPTTLGQEKRLTFINQDVISTLQLNQPERIAYAGADDHPIEGWIMKPANFDKTTKYPLILYIHGGPANAYGNSFFHEFQLLSGMGFVVLYVNPHGSQGYGENFADAVIRDWGGKDYEDLMKGVDYALSLGYIDEDNMGVTGGSYGGYMTNWIVGHTGRFKAACTQRSVSSRYSYFGTSDAGFRLALRAFDGGPWEAEEQYLKHSPVRYAGNITTPLLIIHSENDRRCPIDQAEQLFAALKVQRKEVLYIRYSGENHNLSRGGRPVNRLDRLRRISGWFKERLG